MFWHVLVDHSRKEAFIILAVTFTKI